MGKDRSAFAILMAAVAALTALSAGDIVNPKVSVGIAAAIAGINGLLRVLWPPFKTPFPVDTITNAEKP